MKHPVTWVLKRSIRLAVLLTLMILPALYYLGETESGLAFTVRYAQILVPGLRISAAHGYLFSSFTLSNLRYITATQNLQLTSIDFNWDAWKLLLADIDLPVSYTHLTLPTKRIV